MFKVMGKKKKSQFYAKIFWPYERAIKLMIRDKYNEVLKNKEFF